MKTCKIQRWSLRNIHVCKCTYISNVLWQKEHRNCGVKHESKTCAGAWTVQIFVMPSNCYWSHCVTPGEDTSLTWLQTKHGNCEIVTRNHKWTLQRKFNSVPKNISFENVDSYFKFLHNTFFSAYYEQGYVLLKKTFS